MGIIVISDGLFLPIFLVRSIPWPYALVQALPFNTIFLVVLGGLVFLTSFFRTKEIDEYQYRGQGAWRIIPHILTKTEEEKLRARNEGIVMIVIGLLLYLTFHLLIQTVPPQFII